MTKYRYSLEEAAAAIETSTSLRQAMLKLGIAAQGGNYRVIKKLIEKYNLDASHFTGKAWNKGITIGPQKPIDDYLSNSISITSHKLRLRLIKEGIKEHLCENCGLSEWLGRPISLELNHIDGNNSNNNLINLSLLCPNCHAQTPNYRGLNKKKPKPLKILETLKSEPPKEKYIQPTKILWPSIEDLVNMIKNSSFLATSKQLGVSDNAVRKHLKKFGVDIRSKFSHDKLPT